MWALGAAMISLSRGISKDAGFFLTYLLVTLVSPLVTSLKLLMLIIICEKMRTLYKHQKFHHCCSILELKYRNDFYSLRGKAYYMTENLILLFLNELNIIRQHVFILTHTIEL